MAALGWVDVVADPYGADGVVRRSVGAVAQATLHREPLRVHKPDELVP